GIAAVLVLGIAIGRVSHRATSAGSPVAVATKAPTAPADGSDSGVATRVAASADDSAAGAAPAVSGSASPTEVTNPARSERNDRIRSLRESAPGRSRDLAAYGVERHVPGAVGDGSDMSAYRLAVVEHMARTEVLLTSFRAQARTTEGGTKADAQFGALARDLLRNTRLLLATRTNDDPVLTHLLEDLELVLMQISQYTAEGRRGDLDAINQSLDRRNVLPKLRSTIPAGASASAGT
ncbi:MAG: hypothetical protein ACJ8AD_03990, partial [Gemmatimonadaceae bacterium]